VIVIVEERETVKDGYTAWFDREGVSATGLCSSDFDSWVKTVSEHDMLAVEAFLLGDCLERNYLPKLIRGRSSAPVIAMNDNKSLDETLDLFAAGVDDVVRKPIHVREILARIRAIRARVHVSGESRARCRISSEYALPMPLNRCGSVKARFNVWLSRASAARKLARSLSRTSRPPGSCARNATSSRTKWSEARFLELASVTSSVPLSKSNAASPTLPTSLAPRGRHRSRPAIIR